MSEFFFYEGDDRANLYEQVDSSPVKPISMEEALANSRGGDPAEWIPEAERIHKAMADAIQKGGTIAMMAGKPESEGVFAGYYPIKIPMLDRSGVEVRCIIRTVYATFEQVAQGDFIVPEEGLFCIDPEN